VQPQRLALADEVRAAIAVAEVEALLAAPSTAEALGAQAGTALGQAGYGLARARAYARMVARLRQAGQTGAATLLTGAEIKNAQGYFQALHQRTPRPGSERRLLIATFLVPIREAVGQVRTTMRPLRDVLQAQALLLDAPGLRARAQCAMADTLRRTGADATIAYFDRGISDATASAARIAPPDSGAINPGGSGACAYWLTLSDNPRRAGEVMEALTAPYRPSSPNAAPARALDARVLADLALEFAEAAGGELAADPLLLPWP
jgi:hypothetical protein